jgi:transketolase
MVAADRAVATAGGPTSPASRKSSRTALEAFAPALPELLGGSADLTGSNLTCPQGSAAAIAATDGRQLRLLRRARIRHDGDDERPRAARRLIPYTATFLVFSEYARNAVRMAALMKLRTVFVFTHDSIGLGEDGPTHQPVEQTASAASDPEHGRMASMRRGRIGSAAWASALKRDDGPTSMMFSRQNLPHTARDASTIAAIARGGYVLSDADGAQIVLIGTGSEVALALAAQKTLAAEGIAARVVSMPSTTVFDRQDAAWREKVLPRALPRVAVEAGVTDLWRKYVGLDGAVIGLDHFGESAPAGELYKAFGITAEAVAAAARKVLGR